jgi:CRP/FNR family transcriptional regulator, anaerobic regulatory protein
MPLMKAKRVSEMAPHLVGQTQSSSAIVVPGCDGPRSDVFGDWVKGHHFPKAVGQTSHDPQFKYFERKVDSRRVIFHKDEPIEGIPVIRCGWAAIVSTLPNNRRQIVTVLLPGDLVSGALIFDDKLDVSVEAITDVTYRGISRSEFQAAIFKSPSLLESVLKIWNEQSLQIVRLATSLGQCTAEERVAGLMMNLFQRLTTLGLVTVNAFHFPLRQSHIAEITGLTPVHVSRVINVLRRDGLIGLSSRMLTVRDPVALAAVCNRKGAHSYPQAR